MKWWCRVSMRISASSTNDTYAKLKSLLPEIVQDIASKLGIRAKDIQLDNVNVIPYIEDDNEGVIDDKHKT